MKKKKRPGRKSSALKYTEYVIAYMIFFLARIAPLKIVKIISNILGDLFFFVSKRRRNIAIENLTHAFKNEKSETEIRDMARQSCRSILLTLLEIIKLRCFFADPATSHGIKERTGNVIEVFKKAKRLHDEYNGCIFITPHLGNWELLPHVSSAAGITMAIVLRPLDNEYLEKLFVTNRVAEDQFIIPKKNGLYNLQKTLQKGISLGMMPDQSTAKGFEIDFFGRTATTTPIPAMLSVKYKRPIVAVACFRKPGDYQYEGYVGDPIMPDEHAGGKAEMLRITEEMTRQMEDMIRKYPEQYLWIHNRWKTYKGKKEFLS